MKLNPKDTCHYLRILLFYHKKMQLREYGLLVFVLNTMAPLNSSNAQTSGTFRTYDGNWGTVDVDSQGNGTFRDYRGNWGTFDAGPNNQKQINAQPENNQRSSGLIRDIFRSIKSDEKTKEDYEEEKKDLNKSYISFCKDYIDMAVGKYADLKDIKTLDLEAITYRARLTDNSQQDPKSSCQFLQNLNYDLDQALQEKALKVRRLAKIRADEIERKSDKSHKVYDTLMDERHGDQYPENVRLLFSKAEDNDLSSQIELYLLFEDGIDTKKDAGLALYWLRRAATSETARAKLLMADNFSKYYEYSNAFRIYSDLYKDSRQDLTNILLTRLERCLGFSYLNGKGVNKNESYACWYFKSAAAKKDSASLDVLKLIDSQTSEKKNKPIKPQEPPEVASRGDSHTNQMQGITD